MTDRDTDANLLKRLRAGDEQAFALAYEQYRPRIFSFLVRLSGQRSLAEDMLQETFVRLAVHAPRLRGDTQLGAWLYRVARNLFVSHKRWQLLDAGKLAETRLYASLRPLPVTPFAVSAANETQRRLEQSLASLRLRYREVLVLVLVEGLSQEEAAAVIGVTPAALRQRLKRGRDKLKTALTRKSDGPPDN